MHLVVLFALLPHIVVAQNFFTLKGHGGPIKGIAAGADGTILTASFDNSVGVWRHGQPLWLEDHTAAVNAVAYLGNGKGVSAGDDFTVRLWNSAAGMSRELGRHDGKVIRLAVSPDKSRVASASWDGTARIWHLGVGVAPVEISGHADIVNDVAFSPDGARLYSASADGTIRIWDTVTGAPIERLVEHGFGINTIVLAHDETWIAYGAVDGGTRVIALPGATVIGDFTLDRRPILAMDYHVGTSRIAVGDAQGYIMMIDATSWQIADDFQATLSGPIWSLAFSPDGQNIHAGGLDNAMYSWPVGDLGGASQMVDTKRSFLKSPEKMSNGERQFQRKCSICHTLGLDGERRAGPSLYHLFGRQAGSMRDYPYSETLQTSDIIWSDITIDQLFDQGPDHFIPGSNMPMQRITAQTDRSDLITFLKNATSAER